MSKIIEGYALLFGVQYDIGEYIETISHRALDGAILSNVKALRDHNASLLLAANDAEERATLKLEVDNTGLFFRLKLPDTALGAETWELMERKDLMRCSWGFSTYTDGNLWSVKNGRAYREVRKVSRVYDVSLVTYPANPDTEAWIRPDLRSEELDSMNTAKQISAGADEFPGTDILKLEYAPIMEERNKFSAIPQYECCTNGFINEARSRNVQMARTVLKREERYRSLPESAPQSAPQSLRPGNTPEEVKQMLNNLELKQRAYQMQADANRKRMLADTSPEGIADTLRRFDQAHRRAGELEQPRRLR
jgi:HK97 family phage prohead protease